MTSERSADGRGTTGVSRSRRDLLRSVGALAAAGCGGAVLGSVGAATGGSVDASATTLTLLPASEACIDPPAGATSDAAWDGDCEDTSAAEPGAPADRKVHHAEASAMPDHYGTTLDAWFLADQTSRLPAYLSTALDIRKDFPEYPGESFKQYRVRNTLGVSLPTTDGRTIADWSAVRVASNRDDPPTYVLVEGEPGEANALRDLIEDAPAVPESDVDATLEQIEGAEKLRATTTIYADHADGRPAGRRTNGVSVDGVEGVRVTQIYGGTDTYVVLLKRIYDDLRDRYGPVTANRKFREYTGVQFEAIPAFVITPPTMYTFLDLVATADGARAIRVWDASPYPKHYLYADAGERVDQTEFEEGRGFDPLSAIVRDGDWHPREDFNRGPFAKWVSEAGTPATPFEPHGREEYEAAPLDPVMEHYEDGAALDGAAVAAALGDPQYPWG